MSKSITEILGDAEKATIIATGPNGEQYVNLADYVNLTTADVINGKNELRTLELNPDGTPSGSIYHYLAVNVEQLCLNRYKIEDDKVMVITDWWSISEQDSGQLPRTRIPCYVIARKGKDLICEKTITVSGDDFLANYTKSLDREAMLQILPIISGRDKGITEDKLPI